MTTWHADFTAARKALQADGYKGSFCLKRGMPMYNKIEEMRQARFHERQARFHELHENKGVCVDTLTTAQPDVTAWE